MAVYTRKRPTYKTALELARQLSARDRRRLRAELAKLSNAHVVRPSRDPKVIRMARARADEIRKTVQYATANQSLDDCMRQMRGRSWS